MHNTHGNTLSEFHLKWPLLYFFLLQDERTHVIACQFIMLIMGSITGRKRLGPPAPTISCFGETQIFNVYLIHHLGIFLLYLKIDQAILLLLLLWEEWAHCEVAQKRKYPEEGQ